MAAAPGTHYEVLGVAPDAPAEEIRRAYRRLAVQWHPDKNPGNEEAAAAEFQRVSAAYEVLSDPERRARYDQFGADDVPMDADPRAGFARAADLFARVFGGRDPFFDFFDDDPFARRFGGADPFANDPYSRRCGGSGGGAGGPGVAGMAGGGGMPGMGGMSGGMAGAFGLMDAMLDQMMAGGPAGGAGGAMASSSSSSFSSSRGGSSVSTSSQTTVGPDGRRVTVVTRTVRHPDGREETTTEERVDDGPPPSGALGFDPWSGGGAGGRGQLGF